ncbi:putative Gnk2-like domain-containing protein [Rosa chinensis]|uniref:Putative Gnk2-like domain-containing protein n=1 Tax=Rosa chinensis TaxID=74649 RepID=A0A2P6RQT2_ROSCH|nr:putative Gnk2-like domain-containing protein [Rosa chinensis]
MPDLSKQDCTDCLIGAYGNITTYSYGKDGARILKPSCNIRYEPASFLDRANVAPLPSSPPIYPPSPSTNSTNSECTLSIYVAFVCV